MQNQSHITLQSRKWKKLKVSRYKDISNSDADTSSSEVSVATVTCIQQDCKKEEFETPKTDHNQQKGSQPLTDRYIPPPLRSRDNLKYEQLLFRVIESKKSGPKILQLTGTIKNKDITILVDFGSSHNVIDINKEK